uniref:Uncharacterized protein n=1 Tax=Glossina palpalis gambiensis TaxID=67801 RepID=A0A1B0BL50_9MUSC
MMRKINTPTPITSVLNIDLICPASMISALSIILTRRKLPIIARVDKIAVSVVLIIPSRISSLAEAWLQMPRQLIVTLPTVCNLWWNWLMTFGSGLMSIIRTTKSFHMVDNNN